MMELRTGSLCLLATPSCLEQLGTYPDSSESSAQGSASSELVHAVGSLCCGLRQIPPTQLEEVFGERRLDLLSRDAWLRC